MTTRATASAGNKGGRSVPGASAKAAPLSGGSPAGAASRRLAAVPASLAGGGPPLRGNRHQHHARKAVGGRRPSGKGQARGQARNARGEPPSTLRRLSHVTWTHAGTSATRSLPNKEEMRVM